LGEKIIDSYPHIWQIPRVTEEDVERIPWEIIELIFRKKEKEESYFEDEQEIIGILDQKPLPERDRSREWDQPDIFERCAWYQSHHFWPRFYGIFIREDCIVNVARELYHIDDIVFRRCNFKCAWEPAYISALALLFAHELYHFNIDLVSTYLESIIQDPMTYIDYFNNYYSPNFRTSNCIEESLANRYVYGRYQYLKLERSTLEHLFSRQPPGYREYDKYKGTEFHFGERNLLQIILDHGKIGAKPFLYDLSLEQLFKRLNPAKFLKGYQIPIYLVISKPRRYIRIYGTKINYS